jgi:hypothetical protein
VRRSRIGECKHGNTFSKDEEEDIQDITNGFAKIFKYCANESWTSLSMSVMDLRNSLLKLPGLAPTGTACQAHHILCSLSLN